MSEPARKPASYEDLFDIPENMTGEIINGELVVHPRPSRKHAYAASALGGELTPAYQFGRGGGPGGWIILEEPEIGLGEHTIVPDFGGWKRERFPVEEPHNWISVAPDWVCEIISPKTALLDRTVKKDIYAKHRVGHLWLIDPINMTLEVYRLGSDTWDSLGTFGGKDKVRTEPFSEIEIDLSNFWLNG